MSVTVVDSPFSHLSVSGAPFHVCLFMTVCYFQLGLYVESKFESKFSVNFYQNKENSLPTLFPISSHCQEMYLLLHWLCCTVLSVNTLFPSDTIWCQTYWLTFAQVMACRLYGPLVPSPFLSWLVSAILRTQVGAGFPLAAAGKLPAGGGLTCGVRSVQNICDQCVTAYHHSLHLSEQVT